MKTKILSRIIPAFLFLFSINLEAQVQWNKFLYNPVVSAQDPFFEAYGTRHPSVLADGDTFRMWYIESGQPYLTNRVAYAWSTDGTAWNRTHNVFTAGAPGDWDQFITSVTVVKDGGGYKMFYAGDKKAGSASPWPSGFASIGVALSVNGKQWSRFAGNPILTPGQAGSWDDAWIESPTVLFDSVSSTYQLWYTGADTSVWKAQTGLATSSDGLTWSKHPGNPVIHNGIQGSFDAGWITAPSVVKTPYEYQMWYAGQPDRWNDTSWIGYAHSTDGILWVKSMINPVLNTFSPPQNNATDSAGPRAPSVVFKDNIYRMWYHSAAGICLATAPVTGLSDPVIPGEGILRIFPNPGLEEVSVHLGTPAGTEHQIILSGSDGRIVMQFSSRERHFLLKAPGNKPGIYILTIKYGDSVCSEKLIFL